MRSSWPSCTFHTAICRTSHSHTFVCEKKDANSNREAGETHCVRVCVYVFVCVCVCMCVRVCVCVCVHVYPASISIQGVLRWKPLCFDLIWLLRVSLFTPDPHVKVCWTPLYPYLPLPDLVTHTHTHTVAHKQKYTNKHSRTHTHTQRYTVTQTKTLIHTQSHTHTKKNTQTVTIIL